MCLLQSRKFKFNSVRTCEGSEFLACLLAHKLATTATLTQAGKTAPWSETKDSWPLSAVTLARGSLCPSLHWFPQSPGWGSGVQDAQSGRRTPRSGNSSPIMGCKLTCQALWPGGRRSFHDTGQWVNLPFPPVETQSVSRPWEDGPQKQGVMLLFTSCEKMQETHGKLSPVNTFLPCIPAQWLRDLREGHVRGKDLALWVNYKGSKAHSILQQASCLLCLHFSFSKSHNGPCLMW